MVKDKNKKVKQEHKENKKEEIVELTKEEALAMNQKIADAEDRFLRAQADLVNYRKRKDPREGVIEKPLDLAACHFVCHCRPVAFSGKCKPGKPDQHYDTDQAIRMYCDDPCG